MEETGAANGPVRICYLIGSLERCGTSIHLLTFLRGLDRTRYTPWVVGLAQPGPIAQAIRDLGIEVHEFKLRSIYRKEALDFVLWLARRIRSTRTSVVQSYLFLENMLGPPAARLGGARAVITGRRTVDEWESRRHLQIYRMTNPLVNRIVGVSTQVVSSVLLHERVPKEKVALIRNAQSVETLSLRTDPADEPILADLDEKTRGKFIFGTVGNCRPIKGHDVFLKAFARVAERHPDCHLVIVGGIPPGPPYLERLVEELGLSASVHLVGLRSSVAAFVNRFSVFVLPSLAEGMSNALLEAMILGKPCIASRFGLPGDETGIKVMIAVRPGNVDDLAEAMESVLTDDELRERLAAQSRGYAARATDVDRMVGEYQTLYEELLNQGQRA